MIFISSKTSDGNMMILSNRNRFLKNLGINPKSVREVKQMHGNKIVYIDKTIKSLTEADGLITNKKGLFLIIKIADCMPIAFYDQRHRAIALLHVGYKGLKKNAIKNTLDRMEEKFNTQPKDIIIKIGPSIGPCHYKKDIWKEAESQLVNSGILEGKIENPRICTYESEYYYSHRRFEDTKIGDDSRFITVLGMQKQYD